MDCSEKPSVDMTMPPLVTEAQFIQ